MQKGKKLTLKEKPSIRSIFFYKKSLASGGGGGGGETPLRKSKLSR